MDARAPVHAYMRVHVHVHVCFMRIKKQKQACLFLFHACPVHAYMRVHVRVHVHGQLGDTRARANVHTHTMLCNKLQ